MWLACMLIRVAVTRARIEVSPTFAKLTPVFSFVPDSSDDFVN